MRRRLAIAVVVVASGLAACGDGGSESSSDPTTTTTSTTTAPATTGSLSTTTSPASGQPPSLPPSTAAPTTAAPSTTAPVVLPAAPAPSAPAPPAAPPVSPVAAPATPPPAVPGLGTETGDLQRGAKGARTLALQQALVDQKYDPGGVDGSFGLNTTLAVWAWQALHDRPRTGVVDAATEQLILARPAQPMLQPDKGPTHTEIDLTRQVMVVFRDGRPALITHVSTGSGRRYCNMGRCGTAVTPLGEYAYQRRISGWRVAPLGRLYNPVYFNGGIAVHGSGSVPNTPASHGCVRIPMHIAEYFPDLVANGDAVTVLRT